MNRSVVHKEMKTPDPQLIAAHLERAAKQQKTVFYGDLTAHFGLPPLDGAWSSHPLAAVFGVLDQEDAIAKRPFRTAVVVRREDRVPGDGFFQALELLRGIKARNSDKKLEVFIAELKAVYAFPWP